MDGAAGTAVARAHRKTSGIMNAAVRRSIARALASRPLRQSHGRRLGCRASRFARAEEAVRAAHRISVGYRLPVRASVLRPHRRMREDSCVLFESRDGGRPGNSTARSGGMRPRALWQPGAGGPCLHSIVPCPGDPDRGSTREFRRGERAYRGRRRDVAARQREPPGACCRCGAQNRLVCNVHRPARSGCSCSPVLPIRQHGETWTDHGPASR